MTPSTATSMERERIIPNESEEQNVDAPGAAVTVSFPALVSSGSSSSSPGYGPTPSSPFSEWRTTSTPSGT